MDRYTAELDKALAKGIGTVRTADLCTALRLRYVGAPIQDSSYGDCVVVSASSVTLSVNGAVDTTVGTAGVITISSGVTTLGALVDAINLSANWEAEIVAGLRSDAINGAQLLARSTSTFKPYTEVKLNWDSSAHLGLEYVLESAQPFDYVHPKRNFSLKQQHRVGLQRIVGLVDTSDASAWVVNAFELGPDKASSLRTLVNMSTADNTKGDTGVDGAVVHAGYGNSILVRITSNAAYQDAGAYLNTTGVRE